MGILSKEVPVTPPLASQKRCRIYLYHGSGWGNAGDSAQMLCALERLERMIPDAEVVVAKVYAVDDTQLYRDRPIGIGISPFLHKPLPPIIRSVMALWRRIPLLGRLHSVVMWHVLSSRGRRLVWAAAIARRTGRVPLLNAKGREFVRLIASSDAVYCSGGGNLNDKWLTSELVPRCTLYRVAHALRKPLIVSGQGIGPLKSRKGEALLARSMRWARIIGCRDFSESRDLLLKLGLEQSKPVSLGDDATDLRVSPPQRIREILQAEAVTDDGKPLVAVHVRLHTFPQDFRKHESVTRYVQTLDAMIEELDCRLLFIPITYARAKAYDQDMGDAFEIFTRLKNRNRCHFICREAYSPPDMKGVVAACKLVVAFSYHAWVFGMTSGVPALGLFFGDYFRLKAEGFFAWYDRRQWAINIQSIQKESFLEMIREIMGNYDCHRRHLLDVTQEMSRSVQMPAQMLRDALQQDGSPAGC
ncbi:MAG: polysaccharide pyruvyl transferase family protein [Planctomycetaceae bacterium]|nr:polysaccharide pyruvyl transferase family protein [Planctomycetaceae bacterium]